MNAARDQFAPPGLTPHPILPRFYARAEDRQSLVDGLFAQAAPHYDRVTSLMCLGTGRRYRQEVLERIGVRPGARVLDVACGTGQVGVGAAALVGPGGFVLGIDPSREMRAIAESRGLTTAHGTADALPVPDGSFDFVVMGYALRHVKDLVIAFREMGRALKPGGVIAVLEITPPRSVIGRSLLRAYLKGIVPAATLLFTQSRPAKRLMDYYWESIHQCVSPEAILGAMGAAGLVHAERSCTLGMFTEYVARTPSPDPAAGMSPTGAQDGRP